MSFNVMTHKMTEVLNQMVDLNMSIVQYILLYSLVVPLTLTVKTMRHKCHHLPSDYSVCQYFNRNNLTTNEHILQKVFTLFYILSLH